MLCCDRIHYIPLDENLLSIVEQRKLFIWLNFESIVFKFNFMKTSQHWTIWHKSGYIKLVSIIPPHMLMKSNIFLQKRVYAYRLAGVVLQLVLTKVQSFKELHSRANIYWPCKLLSIMPMDFKIDNSADE